ncbi:MAG: hypothetical protein LQ345_006288 [Seirophora villosa]|nr:MAG: hypothetical protein LQ345_006288 [Seirophora villosa]
MTSAASASHVFHHVSNTHPKIGLLLLHRRLHRHRPSFARTLDVPAVSVDLPLLDPPFSIFLSLGLGGPATATDQIGYQNPPIQPTMEVSVDGAAPRDGPGHPVKVMEIRNKTVQAQKLDLEPLNKWVRKLCLAKKHHGRAIRHIRRDTTVQGADVDADIASVDDRRMRNAEATERRLRSVEDAASAAQLAQQLLDNRHEQFQTDVGDRLEAQASDARDAVRRSLQDWSRRLEDEMQRIDDKTQQRIRDQLEPVERAVDQLETKFGRLSIDADPAVPGDDRPTLGHDEPAVPYATDGRVDELERTFHAYHQDLQARTAELERLGRLNGDASNATIRACNTQLARYLKRMQAIDAVHTTVRRRLRGHAVALRRQTARISAAERTAQAHRAETDQARRETDDRLRDQSTRLDRLSDTLAGADIQPLERALGQVRWDQANDVARLDDFGARLDDFSAQLNTTNIQVRRHAANIRHTLHNHRSRLDATDTQLEGHSADLRRIDSTLQELGSSHTTLGDRVDRWGDLLHRDHHTMSRYIAGRVDDAMEGTVETGMSRAMRSMHAEIERLGREVERSEHRSDWDRHPC